MSAGIEPLKTCIRIWWRIDGIRHRETLKIPPTPENCQKAKEIANLINAQIKLGIFDKDQVFPNSSTRSDSYFSHYINLWKNTEESFVAPSSWDTYISKVEHHIEPYWKHKQMVKISIEDMEDWVYNTLIKQKKLNSDTIKDILMLWRKIYKYWSRHQKNSNDPTEYIKLNSKDPDDIDPFTRDEARHIINAEIDPTLKNLWTVMLWSGLSSHELLPLAVEDLDLNNGYAYIRRGFVKGVHRVTKNRRRKRQIELLPIVIDALASQCNIVKNNKSEQIMVIERDHRTHTSQKLQFLWHNPKTNTHYNYSQIEKKWQRHLKLCNIKYRPPNNGRHTYASQVLSTGTITAEWLANQLGHSNTEMIHRHYGKFIPKEAKHIITRLNQALNINQD